MKPIPKPLLMVVTGWRVELTWNRSLNTRGP